ncbi:GH-E family nuclease [uncultured Fluviicola sp.]|uniref:GH-E family nuclease n=1 Tax=uncultured Fluviicola sp. TaxID=463303 RepID=UPI0025ED4B1F|nr:GH-E family nuclease [uncultured Fluviicola sp.]
MRKSLSGKTISSNHQSTTLHSETQKKRIQLASFQDNRPEAAVQRESQENADKSPQSAQLRAVKDGVFQFRPKGNAIIQLNDKKRKRDESDDDDDEYKPPNELRKYRRTFNSRLRIDVIKRTALRNKNGHYVCPGCGMPLATNKGKEIETYYISKSNKRHDIKSAQMDHYPPWSKRLEKHRKKKSSEAEINRDHDDPTKLRALCLRCNGSHKFEKTEDLPEDGYSDDEYYSDDDSRDDEIWKNYRDNDDDDPSGVTA